MSGRKRHAGEGTEDPPLTLCLSLPQPKKRLQNTPEKAQLFPAGSEPSSTASSPQGSPRPRSPMGTCWEVTSVTLSPHVHPLMEDRATLLHVCVLVFECEL